MRWPIMIVLLGVANGCAHVNVAALNLDGTADKSKAEGLQYYLPKPYLLVVSLPEEASRPKMQEQTPPKKDPAGDATPDGNKTPAASVSDMSFLAATKQYQVKLIYLPDFSRRYAVSISAGLGTAQMNAQLQNGWMLTSLNGSSDSKIPETITALAALASSIGGAVTGAGGAAKAPTKTAFDGGATPYQLFPGLYEFVFDLKSGALNGLRAVTYFCDTGLKQRPSNPDGTVGELLPCK